MEFAEIVRGLAAKRKHAFDLEWAVYLTVLHRLFASGSDRAAEVCKENYRIARAEEICLHQLYRTMGWLGEEIGMGLMGSPRCTKELIEEALFDRGRDLFKEVGLVFFDTTSIPFEGNCGESIGQHRHSKVHRHDLHQMIASIASDVEGRPIGCKHNGSRSSAGASTNVAGQNDECQSLVLVPLIERMRTKFRVREACVVADRGFVSATTLAAMAKMEPPVHCLIGVNMRRSKEVGEVVWKDCSPW